MTSILPQFVTLAEFLTLPETEPASEYIEGCIYQKPMPQGKHSRLQIKLCHAIHQVAEKPCVALVFRLGEQPQEITGKTALPVPDFLNLSLTVSEVFDWLKAGQTDR